MFSFWHMEGLHFSVFLKLGVQAFPLIRKGFRSPRHFQVEAFGKQCMLLQVLPLTMIGGLGGKHPDMQRQCGRQVSGAEAESAESV